MKPKTLTSTLGPLTLERLNRLCNHCDLRTFPADVTIEITDSYTNGLKRLAARCCGLWLYRLAADTLKELCGIALSHTTLGKLAGHTAEEIAASLQNNPDVRHAFQKTKGATDFYADGVFVPFLSADGKIEWREMNIGAYAKRERALSALPSEWSRRLLPKPTMVSAFATIVDKEGFQKMCQMMRRTLGVGSVSSALGDGAKWIWNVVRDVFGKTEECLDVFHAAEHISDCGKVLFGESQAKSDWFESMHNTLLSEGLGGIERELKLLSGLKKGQRSLVDSLLEYFRGNVGRLDYCGRLASGRAIGSGLIEGACKNLVGRRLKQTGAC